MPVAEALRNQHDHGIVDAGSSRMSPDCDYCDLKAANSNRMLGSTNCSAK